MSGLDGWVVIVILLGVAKGARAFGVGPRWLRNFRLERNTYF